MFSEDKLREAAGETTFSRGKAYWREGRVRFSQPNGQEFRATVAGTETYRVKLRKAGDSLAGSCTCPAFADMPVCKHMVAVALAVNALPAAQDGKVNIGENDLVARFLESLPRERLVAMIRDFSDRFPEIDRSLDLAASTLVTDDRTILARFRGALEDAIDIDDYVDYSDAPGWASNVEEVLDAVALLVDDGRADIAMTLVEEAIEGLGQAAEMIDDSDGGISGLVYRCLEIHALAAAKARPSPKEFAARLVELALEHEFFDAGEIVSAYGDILGETGLAEVERLALVGLDLLPPVKRGTEYFDDPSWSDRRSLVYLADDCAARRGDLDARIAVRKRDLSHVQDYLRIVELLVDGGRDADALAWLREALFVFEDEQDDRLVAAALPVFDRAGLAAEADRLVWESFSSRPSKTLFNLLMQRTDATSREEVTNKAITYLQDRLDRGGGQDSQRWHGTELLVDLLTTQARYGDAWQAVDHYQLPEMAVVVENLTEASLNSHPDRATVIWRRQITELVGIGGNENYKAAHKLLARLADVASKSETAADHSAYVLDLRARYRAKRNFMRLF